jgi:hypothetical protein
VGFGPLFRGFQTLDHVSPFSRFHISQFYRTLLSNIRTLQEWEAGTAQPPSAVRAYLTVIDRDPGDGAEGSSRYLVHAESRGIRLLFLGDPFYSRKTSGAANYNSPLVHSGS